MAGPPLSTEQAWLPTEVMATQLAKSEVGQFFSKTTYLRFTHGTSWLVGRRRCQEASFDTAIFYAKLVALSVAKVQHNSEVVRL